MTPTLSDFFAAWPLFREATLSGVAAGAMLGVVGVYVVLRRMVFLSAAVSQASGLGVVLAFYAQLHFGLTGALGAPALWASAITFAALALLWGEERGASTRDARLGVVFLTGMAGSLAVGTRVSQDVHDVQSLLFGTAVAVLPADFERVAWLAVGTIALHAWWHRGFITATFDPDGARVRGLPVRRLDFALLLSLGLAIALTTQVIGALPVFAFCVLPPLAAVKLAPNPQRALVLSGLIGAACGFLGYLAAFLWDLPVGAAQALVALAALALASGVARALQRQT